MAIIQSGFFPILFSFVIYGTLHSLLASHQAKRISEKLLGETFARRWYRLFYNLVALVTLMPVLWVTAVSPDEILWQAPSPWNLLLRSIQMLALVGMGYALLQTGSLSFLGLRQLVSESGHEEPQPFVTGGLYRLVRHPIYTFGLVFLWFSPTLSLNSATFALGITAYILIGIVFEERKLEREFGSAYREYKQKTPALIPGLMIPISKPIPVTHREDR
jgi:protein-S-isoprenylcysteine O-methyltransferase Ste14